MKRLNGHSESQITMTFRQFWNDCTSNEKLESAMLRIKETSLIKIGKIIGATVSVIGIILSIKWVCTSSDVLEPEGNVREASCSTTSATSVSDSCPWKLVFSDMANRLQLLEMAFKDQVVARMSIEREVNNQSYVNLLLDKKLASFLDRLEKLNKKYQQLEHKLDDISSRLYSDESIGFVIIMVIIVQVLIRIRPHVEKWQQKLKPRDKKHSPVVEDKDSPQSKNGVNYSPKHGLCLKNELCVVVFKRDNNNIISTFIDVTIKNLDDVKLASPSHYVIEKNEQIRQIPKARLYLVVSEIDEKSTFGFCRQMDNDIQLSTIRYIKSLGGSIILVVANDESSKKLTAHSLYNTSLRFIQTNDTLQDLASNGKVFSMWRELSSHQMSHLRKNIRTILNLKLPIR